MRVTERRITTKTTMANTNRAMMFIENSERELAKLVPEFGNARYARNLIEQAESRRCESIDFLEMMQMYETNPIQLMPEDFEPIITDKPSKPRKIGFI